MSNATINKDSVQAYLKNPLGLIGLITVVFESIAALALTKGLEKLVCCCERLPIIWFIILFPLIVLVVICILIIKYPTHLYGPGDYKDEKYFVRLNSDNITKIRENEALELIQEEKVKGTYQEVQKAKDLIIDSEAIGLVAASEYFQIPLRKNVVLNKGKFRHLSFDGMAFKGNTLCVAEIKLLPKQGWRVIFEKALTKMQNNIIDLQKSGYELDAVLVLVLKGEKTTEWEEDIKKYFYSREYDFKILIANKNL